jgi:hypothetical protein
LAWSFRELFKHRSPTESTLSPRDELGMLLADSLTRCAQSSRAGPKFLAQPLAQGYPPFADRCPALLAQIGDPVLSALWDLGTLRSLSDLLPHILLREANPEALLWNTADHVKLTHGVDLRAINAEYAARLATNLKLDAPC